MNQLGNLLLLLSISFSLNCFSQQDSQRQPVQYQDSIYMKCYTKLKEMYIQTLYTKSKIRSNELGHTFRDKLYISGQGPIDTDEARLFDWIQANLDKTAFTSYEDARKEYEAYVEAVNVESKENKAFMYYAKECIIAHGAWIYINAIEEVNETRPELLTLYKKQE